MSCPSTREAHPTRPTCTSCALGGPRRKRCEVWRQNSAHAGEGGVVKGGAVCASDPSMTNPTLVLIANSSTGHARWFTPVDHLSGGMVLEERCHNRGSAPDLPPGVTATVQEFAQHIAGAIARVCNEHSLETIVLVAPQSDYLALAAELPRFAQRVPTLVVTDPSWATLPTPELCARLESAGVLHAGARPRTEGTTDSRNPGAVSGAQARFVPSALTPFEKQRMS